MGSSCSKNPKSVAVISSKTETRNNLKIHTSTPRTPKSNRSLSNSTVTGSYKIINKFTVGKFDNYFDLEFTKEIHRPGWMLEKGNLLSYSILMEEVIGVKLLNKFKRYPALGTLPEPCNGTVQRCEYKGYNVVVFKLTHPDNNKTLMDRCVRKLRASGPLEFDNIMTFYGTDHHIVFTSWTQEEKSLQALSDINGYF